MHSSTTTSSPVHTNTNQDKQQPFATSQQLFHAVQNQDVSAVESMIHHLYSRLSQQHSDSDDDDDLNGYHHSNHHHHSKQLSSDQMTMKKTLSSVSDTTDEHDDERDDDDDDDSHSHSSNDDSTTLTNLQKLHHTSRVTPFRSDNDDSSEENDIAHHHHHHHHSYDTDDNDDDDDDELLMDDIFNSLDSHHRTPLHYAVDLNNLRLVHLLAPLTIVPSMFDDQGFTSVQLAVRNQRLDILQCLLDHCPSVSFALNEKCEAGGAYADFHVVHLCCESILTANHVDGSEQSTNNSNNNSRRDSRASASVTATNRDRENMLKFLLSHRDINVHVENSEGENALHICAKTNRVSLGRILVQHGINVNHRANKSWCSPLMVAATLGHEEFVDFLLSLMDNVCMVDLNMVDHMNDSALHYATQSKIQRMFKNGVQISDKHERIAYRLAYCGIDLDIESNDGYRALDFISDNLGRVLRAVNKNPESYPQTLSALIQNVNERGMTYDKQFSSSVLAHVTEREEADCIEKAKTGSCPFATGNKYLMKKRGITTSPSEKPSMPSMPTAHSPDMMKGDISQCPFFKNQNKDVDSTANRSEEAPKSKCPIPFHNELMVITKASFWLYVLLLISCGVLGHWLGKRV